MTTPSQFENHLKALDEMLKLQDLGGNLFNAGRIASEIVDCTEPENLKVGGMLGGAYIDMEGEEIERRQKNVRRLGDIANALHAPISGLVMVLRDPNLRRAYEGILAAALNVRE